MERGTVLEQVYLGKKKKIEIRDAKLGDKGDDYCLTREERYCYVVGSQAFDHL